MRRPRVRFTVRRLMIAVAVASIAIGIERIRQRRADFQKRAAIHARDVNLYGQILRYHKRVVGNAELEVRGRLDFLQKPGSSLFIPAPSPSSTRFAESLVASLPKERELVGRLSAFVEFSDAMRLKYERAARRPWLSVAPDPPEPE